jgi:mRNA (guanine-N7-)-methyltransferase|tara:strand:- start:467 stop:1285 length:819 start_codon:yes stop_codon:yes gene_type:complete
MDEATISQHYDELAERDYNRSKAGLGSAAEVEQSQPAPSGGHPASGGHSEGGGGDGRAVALHYNSLADRHRTLSSGSDILHLRNLNNWIKSVLIGKHMKRGHGVLDLACGKGGDLNKFKIGGVEHYVGIDIAGQSVRDAVHRFSGSDRHPPMKFAATFCVGDFCRCDLEATLPRELRFHLVSCQFALHYSFASEESALRLLRNVACRLQPGGVFVGTTTDANVLIRRLRAAPALSFGNKHYAVTFDEAHASKRFPASAPFGVRYRFSLQAET